MESVGTDLFEVVDKIDFYSKLMWDNKYMPTPDGPQFIRISKEAIEEMKAVRDMAKEQAAWEHERRVKPINLSNKIDLQQHLIDAHDIDVEDTQYYNESLHNPIPKLRNRKRDWSGEVLPQLDHQDLLHWHTHEHTLSEYASDYPHTTTGNLHVHQ